MKSKSKNLMQIACLLFFTLSVITTSAQEWVKSYGTGLYYRTNSNSVFTWSGGSRNGYCHGYGTIQWYVNGEKSSKYIGNVSFGKNEGYGTFYTANGNISYEGYWKNDMRHGHGTQYYSDGSIQFQGNFIEDNLENIDELNTAASIIGKYIMDEIFDGGIHLKTQLIRYSDNEIHIYIEFNGNIIQTNEYYMTLVIKDTAPYVDFINYNDNAESYIALKFTITVADELYKMFNSNSSDD